MCCDKRKLKNLLYFKLALNCFIKKIDFFHYRILLIILQKNFFFFCFLGLFIKKINSKEFKSAFIFKDQKLFVVK